MHSAPCPRCGGPTQVQSARAGDTEQVLTSNSRVCVDHQCEHTLLTVEISLERYLALCAGQYRLNQLRAWLSTPHAPTN
jgi:hypothetical protein